MSKGKYKTRATLEKELASAVDEREELRRIRNRLQKEMDQLKDELNSLNVYLNDTKRDLLNTIKDRDEWRKRAKEAQGKLESEIRARNTDCDILERDVRYLKNELSMCKDNEQRLEAALSMFTDRRPKLHNREESTDG